MSFEKTGIEGVKIYKPKVFTDHRGYFFESFNKLEFENNDIQFSWVQDNQSFSNYGVIRALHFQKPPYAQTKLVRVIQGKILDVAVDIRKNSPTYGKHFSIELSDENFTQLLIPIGCAHGFSVLSETAIVVYKCDNYYQKSAESGLIYNDVDLAIDWKIKSGNETVSEKDLQFSTLANYIHSFN